MSSPYALLYFRLQRALCGKGSRLARGEQQRMAAEWKNRIVGYGEEAPDQLAANPKNWRIHPAFQQDALRGALREIGWVQEVLVNQRTGYVVDGHARVAIAMRDGQATVPVKYLDLSEDEEALVLATLDPLAALAVGDDEQLRSLLEELSADDEGLNRLIESMREEDGPEDSVRDSLVVDHTAKFLESDDPDQSYTGEATAEAYLGTSVRQIVLIMDTEQYADALARVRALMTEHDLETTTDVFFWLLDRARA